MAIGPTGSYPFPTVPTGQGGPIAPSSGRDLAEARNQDGRRTSASFEEVLRAEPLDEADRRQFELERTAGEIHRLNPNAPRGSLVDILV